MRPALALFLLAALPAPATAAVLGEAEACAAGPAVLVTADGFRDRRGNLRIAIYPPTEADFLKGGRYARRLDVPLTPTGPMTVCVGLPAPGDWAVSLLHDRDRSGKFGAFTDGVGFANNPRIGLGAPPVEAAVVRVTNVTPVRVRLLYLQGFRPQPWPQQP